MSVRYSSVLPIKNFGCAVWSVIVLISISESCSVWFGIWVSLCFADALASFSSLLVDMSVTLLTIEVYLFKFYESTSGLSVYHQVVLLSLSTHLCNSGSFN